ncbi:MAG TPA: FAD-dependent oxidoreductase, partial [Pirellulales bacterium]|nr:FAD-dependent oxidoreductase [Pirellulales bacterium]
SARRYRLQVDELSGQEIHERFPGFRADDGWRGLFERRAGYLDVEACVVAHIEEAVKLGAELQTGVEGHGWSAGPQCIDVETSVGRFNAKRLVVTAGPWAPQLLRDLGLTLLNSQSIPDTLGAMPTALRGHALRAGMATQGSGHGTHQGGVEGLLQLRRKPQFWYPAPAEYRADCGCPAYLFDLPDGIFYGLPAIDDFGLKAAEHTGGAAVANPMNVNRELDEGDRQRVEQFLAAHLPGVGRPLSHHSVCMYTLTPDEHFVVDRHPADERIVFAAGLSGHGFKFTGVLGEALADLALTGSTELPIGFLSLKRFAKQ